MGICDRPTAILRTGRYPRFQGVPRPGKQTRLG